MLKTELSLEFQLLLFMFLAYLLDTQLSIPILVTINFYIVALVKNIVWDIIFHNQLKILNFIE